MSITTTIATTLNNIFALTRVKEVTLKVNQPEALTYIETVEAGGVIKRHGITVTFNNFLNPSMGYKQVVLWKYMQRMAKSNNLGELRVINFNGEIYSVE
jgi:hypothetical protein